MIKLIISITALLLTACSQKERQWQLVWSDEFDYMGLPDNSKWSYDTVGNSYGWGNNEAQYYTVADSTNAWVDGGTLRITARIDSIGNKRYSSARLITKGKGDWIYGKVEVSAKLPTGFGTWPAIWMLPTDWIYGGWPNSGEIDIMENVGCDPDTIVATAHTRKYNHVDWTQTSGKMYLPTAYTKFHTYSMEWDENEWRAYIDGKHYYTHSNDGSGWEGYPFDKSFHLILNLAVGGNWGGMKGIDDAIFPQSLEIDWVRVYQQPK